MKPTTVLLGICALFLWGCKGNAPVQTVEEPERFLSSLPVNDPMAAKQLTSGVFDLTNNTWRWTAQDFTVVLQTPPGAAQKGATLQFDLAVPGVVTSKLHEVTLSANVGGTALPPESYAKDGNYTYKRDIPASAFTGDHTSVQFHLDKFLPPVGPETRKLGVLAFKFELDPK